MSQINTDLSNLPQSPTPQPEASIRAITYPQYRRKLGDFDATFIRDNSMGAMGGITGMGFRTFGGVMGDYILNDQFDQLTKDWGVRDKIFHPNATVEDIWGFVPLAVKSKFAENGWDPRRNAKTPDELRRNLAYAAVYPMASEDANDDPTTGGYWATAFSKFAVDTLGDPSNLLGFSGIISKSIGRIGAKTASRVGIKLLGKEASAATKLVVGAWMTAMDTTLSKQIVAGGPLVRSKFAKSVLEMGGLNALQTYAQSIEGEASMQDALGINREQDWIQHGVAGTIGFGFGALFPVVIAGATAGATKVATTSLTALKNRLDQESQNVVVRAILDTTKPMTSVGKIRLEDGALTAVGIVQGSEIVQEAAYQMHRLYKDPKVEIDRWADAHWWERHENTGVTPAVFLKWVTEFNPNRAELTGMLDSLEREAAINRQAQRSNSTLNKIIDQTWKGMGSKRLRIEGVHVGVEPLEPVPGEVVDFDVLVTSAQPTVTQGTGAAPWEMSPAQHAQHVATTNGFDPNNVVGFSEDGMAVVRPGTKDSRTVGNARGSLRDGIAANGRINAALLDGYNRTHGDRPISLPAHYERKGDFYEPNHPTQPTGTQPTKFTTAKGSTYTFHEDGTTTRNKAARPEHPGEQGVQPRSKKTWFIRSEDLDKLAGVQTQGTPRTLIELPDGRIGVAEVGSTKAFKGTLVHPEKAPAVGLIPVESWGDSHTVHFGNEITVVHQAVKPVALPTKSTDGWKLHLSVEEANRSVVSDLLKTNGYAHKVGHNSGQQGKDITVYIGSRADAEEAAKYLSDLLDRYLVMPKGEVLTDDRKFFRKIYGRFDIGRHDPRFHQYGSKGTPFLLSDMDPWNKRDSSVAFSEADKLLTETYGKYYTGQDTPVATTQAVSTLYDPPSLFGPPRPVTADGSIKLKINGSLERGLMTLMRYRGANAKGVRAAVMKRLVAMTGYSEKTIYHIAAKLHNDIGTKVRKARNDLVNVPADKNTRLRITPRGAYVTDITIPDGHALKLWGPDGAAALDAGIADMVSTLPPSLRKVRDEVNAPRVDTNTQYKQAAQYIDTARALRAQDDNAPVGAQGDRVRTKNIAKLNRKAQTRMGEALSEFEPGSRMVTPAEVLSEVSHGVLERPLGVTVEPHESRKIFKNVLERFGLEDNWLVKNGWGKVSKLSRKIGHALIDVGHLATVGSEVPIIAHLSKFVSSIALYNDAFGRIRGYVGPGLEQLRSQNGAKYGGKLLKVMYMLKDLSPDLHESAMRYALARITEVPLPGKMPSGIAKHVDMLVPELEQMFREIGDRGLSNGYFRSLDDNYAGGFAIQDIMRNKPVDLAEALHTVLHRYFGAEDDAPIHRRTFNEVPGAHVRDEKTGNYISNKAVYPEKAPRTVGEMTPDHKRQYMELLAKRDDKVGLWAEAVKIAQNKLGHTELKTIHDTLELATPDPRRQRQLKVGIWFEPELHPFIDWTPKRVIDTYGERVGYRIEEKEAVNFLIKQLTGEARKDFDVDTALSGIKDSLLADPKVDQHARNGIEAAFETLSNQVMALRGTQKHDPLRRMGLMSDAAEMFGHLARTPIGARTGIAGIFTEGVPAILMAGLHNKSITVAARTAIEILRGVTNRNHLKGMLAGISFLRSHVPYEIASVSNTESINKNWLEKTFTNPIKNIGRAQGPVSKLKMTVAAMHRMSAGLGGEDAFQAAVTNGAVYAEMYRLVSSFEYMVKLSKALYGSGPVTESFDKLARDAGFGPDPLYAEQLNQARLLDPEAIKHMLEMDKAVGGKLIDTEGVMDFGLMEEAMLKNPAKGREWQRTVAAIQGFKETRSRSYVTVPGIQDIPTPSGGLSPFDKMSLIFTSFQRSWFSNTMLNTIQHGPMLHSMALLTSVFFGELLYYNIYRMLYRGMTIEDIQSEFEESPTAATMSALARTNFFGSASALGQVTMDIFSDKFASGAGSMYPVNTSVKFLTATANTVKAALSGEQEVDLRDARRIENMAAGLNSWWFQAIVRATGYKGVSDALFDEQTNK